MIIEQYRGSAAEWDAFVRGDAASTHFHLHSWRKLIEEVFRHETMYLCARDGRGELIGVLPLVRLRTRIFGHYLVSMPFVNYGGPLGTPDAIRALAHHAAEIAQSSGADVLELRSRCELPLSMQLSSRQKVSVVLDLQSTEDGRPLWERLDAKVRSQVRRPTKAGVTFRIDPGEIEPFYTVYAAHMRDLGTPALPLRFFRALQGTFGDDVWFGCAYKGERAIAAGCGLRWGTEFEMTWASALLRYKADAANMGLYWHFMEAAQHAGIMHFNFGRCTPGSGTHRFKQQWRARDVPLYWYTRTAGDVAATPAPTDARWAWGPRVWKLLPVNVATALGGHIIRGIP
jgi:FemAB-related protein (PEP-CTERM system-associated)